MLHQWLKMTKNQRAIFLLDNFGGNKKSSLTFRQYMIKSKNKDKALGKKYQRNGIYMQHTNLTFIVTKMRTGRNSSAPGGFWFEAIEALSSKLLMTLQQLRIQTSLSLGALYILIFCSSFCAS